MISRLLRYFIPPGKQEQPEVYRQYKLVVSIMLITTLFDLNYAGITVMIGMVEGTPIMLLTALMHLILPFLMKREVPLPVLTNLYIFFGVVGVVGCIYFSGGFHSPVLPWLASSPIVALLMGGRKSGYFWVTLNSAVVVCFGLLDGLGYPFPANYNVGWANTFFLNCHLGLVIIIFVVALVFENGKNVAFKKLAEKNVLLAEEKKKHAMQQISQEIHDNIGQTLSLAKLNLHAMQRLSGPGGNKKVEETLQLVAKAIQDLREISTNLHSDNITNFNLAEALRAELETISRIGAFKTDFRLSGAGCPLPSQTEFVLFRISQEILNNIIKHAGAQSIGIQMQYEAESFALKIRDDGCGINGRDYFLKGQGLRNIQNRVKLLGGQLDIDTRQNGGTAVSVLLPMKKEELPVL